MNGDKGTVIEFTTLDGINFPKVKFDRLYDPIVIQWSKYEVYDINLEGDQYVVAEKLQIPLLLAWASTVQKNTRINIG